MNGASGNRQPMRTGDVHVVPDGNRWKVEIEGGGAAETHESQRDAVRAGRDRAQVNKSQLLVHGRNGMIRMRNTYGHPRTKPG